MKFPLLFFSIVLFIPNLLSIQLIPLPVKPVKNELFDPVMANRIKSPDDLERYIDSVKNAHGIKFESIQYTDLVSNVIRNRFFHCYSHYSLKENWIAALGGRLLWVDLSAIVIPDDILKYPMAACSQQCIVLMDFFKRKHIDFRKVSFDHHFAVEAKLGSHWVYFDPDLEPIYPQNTRPSLDYLLQDNHLQLLYKGIIPADQMLIWLGHPKTGKINSYPAPRARVFHIATHFLSHWLWIVPLSIFLFPLRKRFLPTV